MAARRASGNARGRAREKGWQRRKEETRRAGEKKTWKYSVGVLFVREKCVKFACASSAVFTETRRKRERSFVTMGTIASRSVVRVRVARLKNCAPVFRLHAERFIVPELFEISRLPLITINNRSQRRLREPFPSRHLRIFAR